jgi:hypothetical protein
VKGGILSAVNEMTFFKHCESRFIPKSGRSLRVGTLSSFRTEENEFVRDEQEGRFSVSLAFNSAVRLSKAWFEAITFGTSILHKAPGVFLGNYVTKPFQGIHSRGIVSSVDACRVLENTDDSIRLSGSISLLYEQFDAFIFCLSRSREKGSVILDESYDSVWSLPEVNLDDFMKILADLILKEIRGGGGIAYGDRVNSMSNIGAKLPKDGYTILDCVYAKVEYSEKVLHVSGSGSPTVSDVANRFERAAFIKPPDFSCESEVRLYFCPLWKSEEGLSPIPFRLKPLLLDCERLVHLIGQ